MYVLCIYIHNIYIYIYTHTHTHAHTHTYGARIFHRTESKNVDLIGFKFSKCMLNFHVKLGFLNVYKPSAN
jgi:hypothetical protein